jgi:hypothetical protein
LINQHRIHHPTDFHQLLPLPAVARKPGDFSCRHRTDMAQTDFRHHTLESRAQDGSGSRSAQVFVHDLNIAPSKLAQPLLHGVL